MIDENKKAKKYEKEKDVLIPSTYPPLRRKINPNRLNNRNINLLNKEKSTMSSDLNSSRNESSFNENTYVKELCDIASIEYSLMKKRSACLFKLLVTNSLLEKSNKRQNYLSQLVENNNYYFPGELKSCKISKNERRLKDNKAKYAKPDLLDKSERHKIVQEYFKKDFELLNKKRDKDREKENDLKNPSKSKQKNVNKKNNDNNEKDKKQDNLVFNSEIKKDKDLYDDINDNNDYSNMLRKDFRKDSTFLERNRRDSLDMFEYAKRKELELINADNKLVEDNSIIEDESQSAEESYMDEYANNSEFDNNEYNSGNEGNYSD